MAVRLKTAFRVEKRISRRGKHDARGAQHQSDDSRPYSAYTDRAGSLVTAATNHRRTRF